MPETYTRVTHQSFGSRMGGSLKALLCAPVVLLLGTWLLVWNEGNSIKQHKALDEGLKLVVDVGIETVDASNEGKLVHFVGKATTTDVLSDSIFGVTPSNVLKLKRNVETYQWVESSHSETKKNVGGSTTTTTTYTYDKKWSETLISSSSFGEPTGHTNPGDMLYSPETLIADPIKVGAFELSTSVTKQLSWYRPVTGRLSTDTIVDDFTKDKGVV
eukprot:scaffold1174_cov105-Cylindrotheca_fusiformis.AAC.2